MSLPLSLCRFEGHTCGACCWGEEVPRATLTSNLRRQTRLFRKQSRGSRMPGRLGLLLHELTVRRGVDLLWAILLLVPGLGDWLRPRLKRRITCAFLGFEDAEERRVGCMIHPSRWHGQEVRPKVAFALLPGFGCGAPDYYCLAAHCFAHAGWREQLQFAKETAAMDWYEFSHAVTGYRPIGRLTAVRRTAVRAPAPPPAPATNARSS